MKLPRLLQRSLMYYWRTNLAVMAGVGTAAGVLAGALIVGESVRASLRNLVLGRLGAADYVISADRTFSESLAERISSHPEFRTAFSGVCPILLFQGLLIHEKSGLRAQNVNVYGVDERFWAFHNLPLVKAPEGRDALIGETLARELSVHPRDTLLLRMEKLDAIPGESLFGRRDDRGRTVRLTCREILSSTNLSDFSLRPSQGNVFSIFVPLRRLQSDLQQKEGANALLVSSRDLHDRSDRLERILKMSLSLTDMGIELRLLEGRGDISVESSRILIEDSLGRAAEDAASVLRLSFRGIYTYLANSIRARGRSIPYSTVTAVDLSGGRISVLEGSGAAPGDANYGDAIWLNRWAKEDLQASVGDTITLDYYIWLEHGQLVEKSATFRLAGVLALEGDAADPDVAPQVHGISDADSLSNWDPPFPIDLKRIRPKDEQYWDRHRTTPKAFIPLRKGQELWKTRFGALTSIRIRLKEGEEAAAVAHALEQELRSRINPETCGFALRFVKGAGIEAARGSTDFGEYFLYFSFFLISAAILLAALFFRLGLEQRISQIGLLESAGFPPRTIRNLFLLEAVLLCLGGSVVGAGGSLAYAGLLLLGLRTWWQGAVGTPALQLHLSWAPLLIGILGGVVTAALSVGLTLRSLRRISPRDMLSGVVEVLSTKRTRARQARLLSVATLGLGLALLAAAGAGLVGEVPGFFGAGASLLASALSFIAFQLRRKKQTLVSGRGWPALIRLGGRNTCHHPGRSLLCVTLISSATFIITSIEAFRYDPERISSERSSGTGGYAILAESVLPVLHDLNSTEGRETLNLSTGNAGALQKSSFSRFRLRPGDDASCLNLYAPGEPRILGAPQEFLMGGRLSFRKSLARSPEETGNPWQLLNRRYDQGRIPAIGDANTIRYILHKEVGDELIIRGERGENIRLLLVAALRDSIFQSELLISEANFLSAFPDLQGYRFFLIDTPPEGSAEAIRILEEGLSDFGFDAAPASERLAAYHRVENTYLSTFQSLGGLGLLLGTIGLAAVLLRNVLERRRELALLQAVGFRKTELAGLVIVENAVLLLLGLASGTACALLAIAPVWISRGQSFPLPMLSVTLGGVLLAGLGSSLLAVLAAFRSPLLPALGSE